MTDYGANIKHKCFGCSEWVEEDEVVWVDKLGRATTGEEGLAYCVSCCPPQYNLDDDGNCLYCGQKCFEGECCDEQQAGGFAE